MPGWIELAIVIGSNLITVGVLYGAVKAKIDRFEEDLKLAQKSIADSINVFVTYRHFDSVVGRIQTQQDEMAQDIKQILAHVSKLK